MLHPGERRALARFDAVTKVSLQAQLVHRAFRLLWCSSLFLDLFAFDEPPRGDVLHLYDDATRRDPWAAWTQLANGRAHFGVRAMRDAGGRPLAVEMFARRVTWDCGPAVAQSFRVLDPCEQMELHAQAPLLLAARSPALAAAAQEELTRARFVVVRAANRAEAIEMARTRAFACILIELGANFADGLELCAQLRARGQGAPVIALSGEDGAAQRLDAATLPGVDSLVRQHDIPRLLAQVVRTLARARLIGPAEL